MQALIQKASLVLVTAILALLGLLALPVYVGAQASDPADPASMIFDPLAPACDKGVGAQDTALCKESGNTKDPLVGPDGVLSTAINMLSAVTGIIAVIIIIVSGIRMITSRGDPNAVNTARDTIIYAAVGIIVVVMARTIILLIADRL